MIDKSSKKIYKYFLNLFILNILRGLGEGGRGWIGLG